MTGWKKKKGEKRKGEEKDGVRRWTEKETVGKKKAVSTIIATFFLVSYKTNFFFHISFIQLLCYIFGDPKYQDKVQNF